MFLQLALFRLRNESLNPNSYFIRILFSQRELEAALAVSRIETKADPADTSKEEEFKVDKQVIDQAEPQSGTRVANLNDAPETNHKTSPHNNSLSNHNAEEKTTSPASSQDESVTGKKPDKKSLEVEELERDKRSVKLNKNEDPQPSTSTGITSKRQRKTVVFKEGIVGYSSFIHCLFELI